MTPNTTPAAWTLQGWHQPYIFWITYLFKYLDDNGIFQITFSFSLNIYFILEKGIIFLYDLFIPGKAV